ncbi:MAG: ATP-binding protein [Deltaproteobacteria bacterium]
MEPLQTDSQPIGSLITSKEWLSPTTLTGHVADRFYQSTTLDAVALVDDGRPVGLVTRPKLLFTLFRRFGFELFGKKPIIAIADTNPLIMREDEKLDIAIDRALSRPDQDIYDEIMLVDWDNRYKGLLSVKQMVIHQSHALANSVVQKEMARERAKELEKVNQVKSQFIAHVTHELRAPVNAIIGLAELMRISSEKSDIGQLRDRLSVMMSSATHLRTIITNILDLSKIEAGKMDVFLETFDIIPLLREVAETARILVGNKPVDVEVVAHDGPVFTVSDPIKVRQILINLTSNAAKFTDKGRLTLAVTAGEEMVAISVKDTGIGIKEADLDKLFTAFSQVEDAKTKRHEGTGLGLTITKNLVDLLGGSISVSSRFGEGTSFEVHLPIKNSKEEVIDHGKV